MDFRKKIALIDMKLSKELLHILEQGPWAWVESIALAVILAILVRLFFVAPYYIPSRSMEPVLQPGDRIIVNKLAYRFGAVHRGEIAVFKFPLDQDKDYIKRIIGLPGETIEGRGNRVLIDGKELAETYLAKTARTGDFGPVLIPPGEYFALGDNRQDSQDSRYWGTLKRELILGKGMFIYWPVSRWRWLH